MQPAFQNSRHLLFWFLGLTALLAMPLLLPQVIPVEYRYQAASRRTGPSDWLTKNALYDKSNLDVLFIGGSDILTDIDHSVLSQEFKKSGLDLKSASIGMTWDNTDFAYYYLRDLFKIRQVKVVVISFHNGQAFAHSATKYIHRFILTDPELKPQFASLALTNYAEMALISLRLLATMVLPPGPQTLDGFKFWRDVGLREEQNHGTWLARVDYSTEPTVEMARIAQNGFAEAPIIEGVEGYSVLRAASELPKNFSTKDQALGMFEAVYYPAIEELCKENHATLLLLKQPVLHVDQTSVVIPNQSLNLGIPVLAAPVVSVFGATPSNEIEKYYYNDVHFNANGAKQNAYAIAKALLPFVQGGAK